MSIVGLDGRFLRVNRALCQIVGYNEEELLARTFQSITHPDDLGQDLGYVDLMIRGEIDTYQMEKRYLHREEHAVWVLLTVSLPATNEVSQRCFFSQVQDITLRKKAEEHLVAALKGKERVYEDLRQATKEIAALQQGLVTICAWTKQVRCGDEWTTLEEFLTKRLGLKLSHGMSDEVAGRMLSDTKWTNPDQPGSCSGSSHKANSAWPQREGVDSDDPVFGRD